MENFNDLAKILEVGRKIVITTHARPDADALGSSLALFHYLNKLNHNVNVITPTDYASFLKWMPGNDNVIMYDENKKDTVHALFMESDVIFCLDFSALDRIGDLGPMVAESKAFKVLIDHHLEPEPFPDFKLWDPDASSASELVYNFLNLFNDLDKIDVPVGECLYAGIMTDTGSFRFPSTSRRVHLILADLIGKGVDNARIHRLIYDDNTESRLRLLGFALSEKLTVSHKYHAAFLVLSAEELERFGYQEGDTEGIVNYALSIRGMVFAGIFMEKEGIIKISFRSRGIFSVNEFARKHFGGGGHKNAAGGNCELPPSEIADHFLSLLEQHKEDLDKCHSKLWPSKTTSSSS